MTAHARSGAWVGLLALVAGLACVADEAGAIPALARRHQISCTTCHAPFPRLKPYGEEFAGRGFRMEEGREPARAAYDVGDPLLYLARDLPLAVRLEGFASFKEDATAESDLEWPWVWKILSGGPLSSTAAYYFYFLAERGEIVGLEDAYLQVNQPLGLPLDLIFGQFQVSDPLFKRELRLTRFDYLIYKTQVGQVPVDLTYDRGLMLLGALPGDIEAVVEVVNGNGIGHVVDEGLSDFKRFDQDSFKNFVLRLARSQGPTRLGVFGYYGQTEHPDSTGCRQNVTTYVGPDLVLDIGRDWQLNAQFLYREDDDPRFTGTEQKHVTRGGFAELHYLPQGPDGRWALTGLYNLVESDDDAADREMASLAVNHLIARNFKLLIEGGRDLEAWKTRLTVGLTAAF